MSYVDKDEYHAIADYLGTVFAATKAGMATAHTTNELITQYALQTVSDITPVATTDAPDGSVASDLGKKYADFGVSMNSTNRETLAASYFTGILSLLNKHILNRSGTSERTIAAWYEEAYTFDGGITDYYFSDDFIDLSAKINVDILTYSQGNPTP